MNGYYLMQRQLSVDHVEDYKVAREIQQHAHLVSKLISRSLCSRRGRTFPASLTRDDSRSDLLRFRNAGIGLRRWSQLLQAGDGERPRSNVVT